MNIFAALVVLYWHCAPLTSAQCEGFFFANTYGDSMVLQRGPASAVVKGYTGQERDVVTVTLGSDEYTVTSVTGPTGAPEWQVTLAPETSPGPFVIEATMDNGCTISLSDVMFGDVYVCSGQSNMQFRMDELDEPDADIEDSVNYPNVRTIRSKKVYSNVPLYDLGPDGLDQPWSRPDGAEQISKFSALCWLFGRNLNIQLDVPIGLIQSAWHGTRIEAWMSPESLEMCWPGGSVEPGTEENAPSVLWNAMIRPYVGQSIFGAIWYQGESNQGNDEDYACALQNMVADWRNNWYTQTGQQTDPVFPFGQVQLAPYRDIPPEASSGFPNVRWAQTYDYGYTPNPQLDKIYTAIAIDLPDFESPSGEIHPRFKRPIAERLFYGAMNIAYGDSSVGAYQGPIPTSVSVGASITVEYDNGAAVLEQRNTTGFQICCADNPTDRCPSAGTWTDTSITSVATSSVDLANPCASPQLATGLRYLWSESPCLLEKCAIYRTENELPAGPYTMDI